MLESQREEATSAKSTAAKFLRSRSAIPRLALVAGLLSIPAVAESVPFNCIILPGEDGASIMVTNSLASDASCIVTCKFSTTKFDNNPQITCAKPVPTGKEVEMCRLSSGGDKMLKLAEGHAECTK
jgi:hypothetical protein